MSLREFMDGITVPVSASNFAEDIDSTIYIIYLVSTFWFVLITGLTIYFCFKYRRRGANEAIPPRLKHNTALETAWTIVPTIIVFWFFWIGAKGYLNMSVTDADAIDVQVIGKKWNWEFTYPEADFKTDTALWLEKDKPVRLTMKSSDVIHSFFVPAFRIKADINANRYSELWVRPTEFSPKAKDEKDPIKGFRLYCAEFCGIDHSRMTAWVHVVDHETWKKEMHRISTQKISGEELFKRNCASCHSLSGATIIGPALNDIMGKEEQLEGGGSVTVDEEYLRESIVNPGAKVVKGYPNSMTPFGSLDKADLDALIEFLKTKSPGAGN